MQAEPPAKQTTAFVVAGLLVDQRWLQASAGRALIACAVDVWGTSAAHAPLRQPAAPDRCGDRLPLLGIAGHSRRGGGPPDVVGIVVPYNQVLVVTGSALPCSAARGSTLRLFGR